MLCSWALVSMGWRLRATMGRCDAVAHDHADEHAKQVTAAVYEPAL